MKRNLILIVLLAAIALVATSLVMTQAKPFFAVFKSPDIASAATISLRGVNFAQITGTAQIDSISGGISGQVVYLSHASTDTLLDGKNLKLAGNFPGTAADVLVLICDGTNWFEIDRSAN